MTGDAPQRAATGDRTVAALLRDAEARLERDGIEAPRIQATTLLGHLLGLDRAALLAAARDRVDPAAVRRFARLVERRARHEPLQYIVGRASFLDFEVGVGSGVFIPRPETEQLVELALRAWDPSPSWAVDVGTGSGAIAIALARARPSSRVLAIDRSSDALRTARRNAADNGVGHRVAFIRGDLLSAVRPTADRGERGLPIGIIVSNPPYARDGDVVQPEVVDHEPVDAWRAGPHGTEVYERLAPQAAIRLEAGVPLALELGYDQSASIPAMLQADGRWSGVDVAADFRGIPRVLVTRRG